MATEHKVPPLQGGCPCKTIRYELLQSPLFVHCCHCTWCQKESGSAFAVNALIGSNEMRLVSSDKPKLVSTPTLSGNGQTVARCPACSQTLWSNYGAGDFVRFVKVGTLDEPSRAPPNINIFTTSKLPWIMLDPNIPAVPEFYKSEELWPEESLLRMQQIIKSASEGVEPDAKA